MWNKMTGSVTDISQCVGFPYVQMIEEELQLSLTTIEESFLWLNESLETCKKSFAKSDIELLPQTPHAKRRRPKRVVTKRDSEKSETAASSVESDKDDSSLRNTRQTRTRHVKQSSTNGTRVTRSTRSRLNFTNSSCTTSSQSSSPDADKTSISKPVYHVVFSPPRAAPVSPSNLVKQRTSAYEAMLEKKNSSSPLKPLRKLATSETPEGHSTPNTPETLKSYKAISKINTPSPQGNGKSIVGTYINHSFEDTPKNVTPDRNISMITPDKCVENPRHSSRKSMTLKHIENSRRSSRKSLKMMTKQLRKISAIKRRESRDTLMDTIKDQVEPVQCEETAKRPRTRLRLKKKTANDGTPSESSWREENAPASCESASCQEVDAGVRLSHDDKENRETCEIQSQPCTEYSKLYKRSEASDISDSDHEVFRVPRTKTRVKKVKKIKVKGSESDLPRTSCSDSDTSTERPIRQSTRTKSRKTKKKYIKTGEISGSVTSENEENVFEKHDSNPISRNTDNKEEDAQRVSVDSGIVSAQFSATNFDLSSKCLPMVTVDNTIEEEKMSTPTPSVEKLSNCINTDKSDSKDVDPELEPATRSKSRKRQAEDEIKYATPKRSCTGSVTSFSRDEQIDRRQTSEHHSSESTGDSGNSDGDSPTEIVPSPECPKEKVVHPRSYYSFTSQSKNTPKPSNLLSGMVTSFIKRTITTPTHISQQMQMEMRRKELTEKQKRDNERIKKREAILKQKMEEQRRKREERMKRVAEHREMKARQEKETKEKNAQKIVERLQTTDKLKEEKLKEEKEMKARMRLKKQQEAEERRKLDAEERMRKRQEMEEDFKRHQELMQRKKEFDDQERQKKIADERKKYEERMTELEKERLAEAEKQRKMIDEENRERQKFKEEREKASARERVEKEKQELERRREREIALRKEMDKLNEMERKRMQLQQQEEQKREEQRRQEQKMKMMIEKHNNEVICKGAMPTALIKLNTDLNSTVTLNSSTTSCSKTNLSIITSDKYNGSYGENYNISNLNSDDSTDDDEAPKKKIPLWAQGQTLKAALIQQHYFPPNLDVLFEKVEPPNLCDIFVKQKPRFNKRGSSAIWDSPLIK